MNTQTYNPDILNKIVRLEIIDDFHSYADQFADNRLYHMFKAQICRNFIEEHADAQKTFLDAGAGRGPYTKMAQGNFAKIYCFEYDANELEIAKKNINFDSGITFRQVDITDIPLEDSSVDVAICSEVLEHIPDNKKAMSELYRVMRPGGRLLFSMPNNQSLLYAPSRLKNLKHLRDLESWPDKNARWEQLRHYTFSPSKIESLAQGAGFSITDRRGAHVIRIPSRLRVFLMRKFPSLFRLYFKANALLGRYAPRFGSFYFLTLQK